MLNEEIIGEIRTRAGELKKEIISYRRHLHKYPELGLEEHDTTRFVESKLRDLNIETRTNLYTVEDIQDELGEMGEEMSPEHGVTGVVGELQGNKPGKTVMLRADMDAIKVTESRNSEHLPAARDFRSSVSGVMHACGHDAHVAMLLGAAEILAEMRESISGRVKFLFQPDEERGCGAKLMLKAGVLEDVDSVFGIHVWSPFESGQVMINKGAMMASVDCFWLEVQGGGGHSSAPHETGDPLLAAHEIVDALYRMDAREIDARSPSLISVESFVSEADWGVIPQLARMRGTIRAFDDEVRQKLLARTQDIGRRVARMNGLQSEFDNLAAFPPTVNTKTEAELARSAAEKLFGDGVISGKPVLSGEDFAQYLLEKPGAFILMGTGNTDVGSDYPHHNPNFDVDESQLHRGAALHSLIAMSALNG